MLSRISESHSERRSYLPLRLWYSGTRPLWTRAMRLSPETCGWLFLLVFSLPTPTDEYRQWPIIRSDLARLNPSFQIARLTYTDDLMPSLSYQIGASAPPASQP